MKAKHFFCLSLACTIFLAGCGKIDHIVSYGSTRAALKQMVDTALEKYRQEVPEYPGGVVLKVISGNDEYFVTAGMGNAVTARSHFRAASCTKTFTASAILLLHQQGLLNIRDRITDTIPGTDETYLPGGPGYDIPYKSSITILDLLRHRAGVFDLANDDIPDTIQAPLPYKGKNYISYIQDPAHTFTFDELIGVVDETGLSYFVPGSAYHYSNTGYTILGKIIERVSGMSYSDYLVEKVLRPMGMQNSYMPVLGTDQNLPTPFVNGYVLMDKQVIDCSVFNMSANVAEGNLISTADDLSLFIKKLLTGKGVLNHYTVNTLMMNCLPQGSNSAGGYGCGLEYMNNLGYGHNGATAGYLSYMIYDPELDLTIVVYTNAWDMTNNMESITHQVTGFLQSVCYESKALVRRAQ